VLQWTGSTWACSNAGTGTITGVFGGTDLTGQGTSGNVTLNLDITKVPQLGTPNVFAGTQTVGSGDLAINTGNLDLPQTSGPSSGVLWSTDDGRQSVSARLLRLVYVQYLCRNQCREFQNYRDVQHGHRVSDAHEQRIG
jgi:hypothetical protein